MKKIFSLVLISIGVAMISVLSQFTIPFGPIPLTLQTLMIGIIGTIYKPSHAFVTVCLYLLLGFLGFPVFAGGAGGASHFLGPTAGFLLFFPFRAWTVSYTHLDVYKRQVQRRIELVVRHPELRVGYRHSLILNFHPIFSSFEAITLEDPVDLHP